MTKVSPSERELDVLKVLWELGESSVREIHAPMHKESECAFTTIQTLLRIMSEKDLVKQRIEARRLYYTANYSPQNASKKFLHKVFDGAVGKLVLSMLDAENLSVDEIRDVEKLIAQARKKKQKSKGGQNESN